jgi:predicted methyltransferase
VALEIPNDNVKLVQGNFIEMSQEFISASSIDLLFTDPPYGSQYLSLYDNLASLAIRVLKDGGSLVTYVGNYALPQVMNMLSSAGLKYWGP